MTLFQHTLGQLLRGEKTETSRLALPHADGEHIVGREMIQYPMGIKSVMRGTVQGWRIKWQVGKDYAIQPARGVKSIGQYRIVDIWWQDVRMLTDKQVNAEGFKTWQSFFETWCAMYDQKALPFPTDLTVWRHLEYRPSERYTAWRMSITVLWDTVDWDAPAVRALQPLKGLLWTEIDLNKSE